MMQQGIASLAPQQAPQGMAPGQAAPQSVLPQQQGQTPQAVTGTLEKLPPQQLLAMYSNPQDMTPKWAVATAYAKAIEQARLMQAASGQGAMAQSAMQAQQPPVVQQIMSQPIPAAQGGIMQGYAGGGAVAFQSGGYAPDYQDARRFGIDLSPYDSPEVRAQKLDRVKKMREFEAQMAQGRAEIPTEASEAARKATEAAYTDPTRARDIPRAGIAAVLAPPPAPQRAPRPGTGRPTAPAPAPAAAAPTPEVTPAPKTDNWADIEQQGLKGIAALQDVYRRQGEVDPELARLRGAAYESAQGIAQRRERDRLAALEAAQKAATAPLMDNQEALLRLAGSIGGKMRFGEALGAMAGAAGGIRGEQRKALEAAQRESRLEQNAIDQLNQALAEKRVADRSGDVDRMRAADTKVAEAQLKVTELRSNVQEKRATEADRAEQRALTKRGQDIQLQVARETAAAKEGAADVAQQRLAIQAMRADPNYASVVKELTEAQRIAAISKSPAAQARLAAAKTAADSLAKAYGVSPAMVGGAAPAASTSTAAPTGWGQATVVKN
jgi:hypothetical protein